MPIQDRMPHSRARGATVLETVVVLAIIILFAGIVAPEVRNYFVRAKAARICAVYHSVSKGSMEYWSDTGDYAIEDSAEDEESSHQLFYKPVPHLPGWSGAYINHPLAKSDNPFKENVELTNSLVRASPLGFDLDDDGAYEVDPLKPGNALIFYLPAGTPPDDPIIQKVEETLEKDGVVKATAGRVMVVNNKLSIFIFQMP